LHFVRALAPFLLLFTSLAPATVLACGGFFCTNAPINQQVERIIFTQSGTAISAYVQINYTGPDAEFAWVVPVPSVPEVDVAPVEMFTELDTLTAPQYIGPPMPEWCPIPLAAAVDSAGGGVTVFSSGEVGPYGYDVVGSDDPQALINWLKDNGYQITPEQEPLVQVYVQEQMLFLAMKLRPGQGVQDIEPVKMSYVSERPMIPLRLTAVAANLNMGVLVWLLGEAQYESDNYARIEIKDEEILFSPFGGSNYFALRQQKIDAVGGLGFITEYAGPTSALRASDPDLQALLSGYPYLTRMYTEISPEEMTLDPTFRYNPELAAVSNVHDLSGRDPLVEYANFCGTPPPASVNVDVPEPIQTAAPNVVAPLTDNGTVRVPWTWMVGGGVGVVVAVSALVAVIAFVLGRRSR
jgi:hypothetical protein